MGRNLGRAIVTAIGSAVALAVAGPLRADPGEARRVRVVAIDGLEHTDEVVARRELTVVAGDELTPADLVLSSQQLAEVGVFRRIEITPVEVDARSVDVHVSMGERSGFGPPWRIAGESAVNAFKKKVELEYHNVAGRGINVGASHRWDARDQTAAWVQWPRPFGIGTYLTMDVVDGRQPFDLPAPTTLRHRSLGVGLRSVLAPHTWVEGGLRLRQRSFDRPHPDASGGDVLTGRVEIERGLLVGPRFRLHGTASIEHSVGEDSFGRSVAGTRASWTPAGWQGGSDALQPFELATRLAVGAGYGGLPLDDMFAPGSSTGAEFPLRGHKLRRDGVLGVTPLGPQIVSSTVEARARIWRHSRADLGVVSFWDMAHLWSAADGRNHTLLDVGAGLRLSVGAALVIRADYAHGLSDGKDTWTFGFGQVF